MELQSFWTDSLKRPTPLHYCCYVRQAILLSHHTSCSHAVKNTLRSKEETDNVPTEKTEQVTFGMKFFVYFLGNKTVLWLVIAHHFSGSGPKLILSLVCFFVGQKWFSVMIGQIACQSNPLRRINWALPMAWVWGQECLFSRVTMQRN